MQPLAALTLLLLSQAAASAQTTAARPSAVLAVPRMQTPPDFVDFLDMEPSETTSSTMVRVDGFVQRWPDDGRPERMRTVAYVGYTDDALHVVYLAFDADPSALRAHLIRREEVFAVNDDEVELRLDTFGDRRQSYYFVSNPLGVQLDAAWPEFEGQYDESFDLVWHTRGERTSQGFVVWMAIPFKSLRFRPGDDQSWGIYLGRWMPRTGEWTFWPQISNRQQSFLSQMARLEGLRDISSGRGIQLIPYATSRAFKAIDARAPGGPGFARDRLDPDLGADAKLVMRDALVLDVTANPDFSQVESDAPQITTNQRFELFFPEKRPFFLENAGFLQTPINLLFTRRLADPSLGARLTGKVGGWTVGGLVADDEAPGQRVSRDHPASGNRTWAGIARVSRRLSAQSAIGGLVTHRTFEGRDNTVAAVDGRLRFRRVWTTEGQFAASAFAPGRETAATDGSAYTVSVSRSGRTVSSRTGFAGASADFVTELGFVPRLDFHQASQSVTYTSRPAKTVNDWGPTLLVERTWAHDGTPLDWRARPSLNVNLRRATTFSAFAEASEITLRPGDAPHVIRAMSSRPDTWGVSGSTSPRPALALSAAVTAGAAINFAPAATRPPDLGDHLGLRLSLGLRPLTPLRIDNTWLRTTLTLDEGRAFATDIVRTRWAWQFTREWSLRFIGQYESTRTNPSISSVIPRRNFNADVLLTRLVNPWTAIYIGYNGNAQNIEILETGPGARAVRRSRGLSNDAWQIFAKWSHLLRW